MLVRILDERPADANALFEELSASVRDAAIAEKAGLLSDAQLEEKLDLGSERARAAVLAYTRARVPMLSAPAVEDGAASPAMVRFPDLLDEARLWAWAGVGFGDATTYLLHLGLRALAVEEQLMVRFWGKVATRSGDYYIAEARTKANPATTRAERRVMEGREGANKYTYYVTKSPGPAASWAVLPHVTVAQLAAAQRVRRFFTGDLAAGVPSFPPITATPAPGSGPGGEGFDPSPGLGTEANLLRAVVGLITADTSLSLAGFLETETEEGAEGQGEYTTVKAAEAPDAVAFDSLKDPGTWVHAELDVSPAGRTQPTPAPLGADGEPVEPEEPDPEPLGPLRGIGDDSRPCGEKEAALLAEAGLETKALWQLRGEGLPCAPCGPAAEEGSAVGKAESASSVVVAKSLKWPGAVAVAREGKMCLSVYNGFGVVSSAMKPAPYEFSLPGPVAMEWRPADLEEDADPTVGKIEEKDVIFEPVAEAEEE